MIFIIQINFSAISKSHFQAEVIFWTIAVISAPEAKVPKQKEDGLPVDIKLPVKHVLSRELQVNIRIILYNCWYISLSK